MATRSTLMILGTIIAVAALGLGTVQPWKPFAAPQAVIVGSTTTTQDTGLLDYLQGVYQRETGVPLKIVVAGTGAILQEGRNGDLDVLLTHDRDRELALVVSGDGLWRKPVMYDEFIVVGPGIPSWATPGLSDNATSFFAALYEHRSTITFVSRGDGSGTNAREIALWEAAGIEGGSLGTPWYKETGAGQADTLRVAAQLQAFTLTDEATWNLLSSQGLTGGLTVVVRDLANLKNQYGVIPISQAKHPRVNEAGGIDFAEWLTGSVGQASIGAFMVAGKAAFYPDAGDPHG